MAGKWPHNNVAQGMGMLSNTKYTVQSTVLIGTSRSVQSIAYPLLSFMSAPSRDELRHLSLEPATDSAGPRGNRQFKGCFSKTNIVSSWVTNGQEQCDDTLLIGAAPRSLIKESSPMPNEFRGASHMVRGSVDIIYWLHFPTNSGNCLPELNFGARTWSKIHLLCLYMETFPFPSNICLLYAQYLILN